MLSTVSFPTGAPVLIGAAVPTGASALSTVSFPTGARVSTGAPVPESVSLPKGASVLFTTTGTRVVGGRLTGTRVVGAMVTGFVEGLKLGLFDG